MRHLRWAPASMASSGPAGRSAPVLVTGADDWTVRVWDATLGRCEGVGVGHGGPVTTLEVRGRRVAARAPGGGGGW